MDWLKVPAGELQEKMAILSAIHMPGVDPKILENEFTPVNTFRILLGEVFGSEISTLERQAYVFHNDTALYDFSSALPALTGENGTPSENPAATQSNP